MALSRSGGQIMVDVVVAAQQIGGCPVQTIVHCVSER
jgi:hypothetical protein